MSWRIVVARVVYWPLRIAYLTLTTLFIIGCVVAFFGLLWHVAAFCWTHYTTVSEAALTTFIAWAVYSICSRLYHWAESVLNDHGH